MWILLSSTTIRIEKGENRKQSLKIVYFGSLSDQKKGIRVNRDQTLKPVKYMANSITFLSKFIKNLVKSSMLDSDRNLLNRHFPKKFLFPINLDPIHVSLLRFSIIVKHFAYCHFVRKFNLPQAMNLASRV